MSNNSKTDDDIHEDHLHNFLVNRLNEKVSLNLANNTEIDAGDLNIDTMQLQ